MKRRLWQLLVTAFAVMACVVSCSGSHASATDAGGADTGLGDTLGDGGPTDVGCGGVKGPPCAAGKTCHLGRDCTSGVCKDDVCQAPSPTDGVKNDSETDVDCGGAGSPDSDGAPACASGKGCKIGTDCSSTVCQSNVCVPATCNDGKLDGSETDVDCGGSQCGPCGTGKKCLAKRDCVSDVCTSDVCQAPTPTDGVKNDSETDVDCGGATLANGQANPMSDSAPACADGKACLIGQDCTDGVCAAGPVRVDNLDGGTVSDGGGGGQDGGIKLKCQGATAQDGVKNDSETDIDCGGALLTGGAQNPASDGAPGCAVGKACGLASDCISDVCANQICQAPTANDHVKNDSETDVDCGGGLLASGQPNPGTDGAPACADHKSCILGSDCVSLVCAPMSVSSGGGTDGGPIDCSSGQTCTCQPATATDGVKNDSETDIDCGGGFLADGTKNPSSDGAPPCKFETNQNCVLGTDCDQGTCNSNAGAGGGPIDCPASTTCSCQPPSPSDGVKNDSETDIDCGGASALGSDGARACAPNLHCLVGSDCQSFICNAGGLCTTPSPSDGVKNDSETDVDCGGATLAGGGVNPASDSAPACADAKHCVLDTDCLSVYCSLLSHTCVGGQSCKGLITPAPIQDVAVQATATTDAVGVPDANGAGESAGIDTCGAGESTDAARLQTHDDCCRSLPFSVGTACSGASPCPAGESCVAGACQARMDKYEVTSGRIRQWVESVNQAFPGYNLRAWVKAQLAGPITPIGTLLAQQIPTGQAGTPDVVDLFPQSAGGSDPLNLVQQLGGTTMDPGVPSGVQGCFVGPGNDGASTYWWDLNGEAQVGSPPRPFTQDYYDIKPINCIPYWIAAAFCAWDGGRLPTQAEDSTIYGPAGYPWGSASPPVLWSGQAPGALDTQATSAGYAITSYTVNYHNGNLGAPGGGEFYFYPPAGALGAGTIMDTLTPGTDLTPYISAPGRFLPDLTTVRFPVGGSEGWQDFGANMLEFIAVAPANWTASANEFCDTTGTGGTPNLGACSRGGPAGVIRASKMPPVLWEGGSWEGHGIQRAGYDEPMHTQYGKAGFRCERMPEP